MAVEIRTEHPHIVKAPGVCGGAPTIRGTRVPVWVLAGYAHQGRSAVELQQFYPHLSLAQIYDALSYWHDHPDEIEAELAANAAP
jgi:uncharacterized protein (DUF433 family)